MDRLHSLAAPVVTHREASTYPSEELVTLLRTGIMQRVQEPEEIPHPRWPDRCRVAIRRTAQGPHAVACEDEEYFEPFLLKDEDTLVYEVHVAGLLDHLRQVNDIIGSGLPAIQGMQPVGQKLLDGFGTLEVFLCFPNDDPLAFRDRCLALRKTGSVKRQLVLVPLPISLLASESELLESRGILLVPLLEYANRSHLQIDWQNMVLQVNAEQRPDGVYGRDVIVSGIKYQPNLTKREMDFLAIALTCDPVPIECVWARREGVLWKSKFVDVRPNRNKLSRFLTDLNAKLAELTPMFPFFFSLVRGERVIVRTSATSH